MLDSTLCWDQVGDDGCHEDKAVYLYFFPGLLKRQNLKFCIYFSSSQTSITCFGIAPWSHGIWLKTDKNTDKNTQKITKQAHSTFTFPARESESRAQRGSGKNFHPSGVSPFSLWPTLPLLPRPQAPPCWVWWLLQWHEVRPRARTPPTTWEGRLQWWRRPPWRSRPRDVDLEWWPPEY